MPGTHLPTEYLAVPIFLALAIGFAVVNLLLGRILRPHRPTPVKGTPYESGIPPLTDARIRHNVRFYLISMLFVLFDIEAVFLYPWAIAYNQLGLFGLIEMIVFIVILLVGYVYAWGKGALDWEEGVDRGR